MSMKRLVIIFALLTGSLFGQTTSTITGTIKDLTGAVVTSGKLTFTLRPSTDVTISGLARFTTQAVTCLINGSGLVKAQDGVSACVITMNTALQPAGSGYLVSFWPYNVKTATIFMYAITSSIDITTVVSTQSQLPSLGGVVDTFSNQTVGGNKTFTGTVTLPSPSITGADSGTETLSNKSFTGLTPFANTGVFTNSQMNEYVTSALNGGNAGTMYSAAQGGNFATESISGAILVPGSANVHQIDGIAGYVDTNAVSSPLGSNNNGVAVYGQCRDLVSATSCWGANFVAVDTVSSSTNHELIGVEIDNNINTGTTPKEVWGLLFNGLLNGTVPPAVPTGAATVFAGAAQIYLTTQGTNPWHTGIAWSRGTVDQTALQVDAKCFSGSCSSAAITLSGNDGANPHTVSLTADSSGNYIVAPPSGAGVRTPARAFSTYPACAAGTEGMYATITDSTTATQGATITGGSTHHVLGYCNSVNWLVVVGT